MTLTSPPSPSDTEPAEDTYRQGGPSVSVIIAAYTEQRWPDTVEAVTSALNQSQSALEVILVIDHNPGLAARAHRAARGHRAGKHWATRCFGCPQYRCDGQ
ncbi:glycosyltransferase family protein [Mycobacterium dioxanotrophicus]|uniref:hypothetical protein n=1 Tax=Mycobacterium dioxanotrophicus TaxID=482462 RepID=UPI0012F86A63|nr:hypothetical protein [Mycobacterium dioxanotrophicus]